MSTNQLVSEYLIERDGSVARRGKAMLRLSKKTGYSVEALRSFAYGRRTPRDGCPRAKKLAKVVSSG